MLLSTLPAIVLMFNELMAANVGTVMSPAFNFDSWVELYNPGDQAVDLEGMYLSDDPSNPMLWQMPSGIGSVPAHGYKVLWMGSNDINDKQAPFKLDCDGGIVCLSDKDGQLIASQEYPEAMSRTAWARKADGTGTWGWTADATPGKSNATAVFADKRLDPPVVSHDSQMFSNSLIISVEIPKGTTLVYTINGNTPAAARSNEPSSSNQNAENNGYEKKEFTITQTTNYKFRLYKDGYLPSVPVTRSYIKTNNKYTLPVISIVGDKRYFTDPKTGIDCDGDGSNGKTGNGQKKPKNYNQNWDRPVNFSYISPEGEMLFNQDVNICITGGWTRSQRYRSFKLKSGKEFDGKNRFDYPFFNQKPYIRNKTLILRNGGNDVWVHNARFMDPALETIIMRSGIDVDVQAYQPVIEYVNGELRGVFNLREPNNDKFAYANFGYDEDELDAFENLTMKNGTDSVINRIFELGREATNDSTYNELKTLLDIDEFTNYMAVNMFLDNDDWPDNNIKAYRSRNNGRYRFVSFDLDYAFALHGDNKYGDNPFPYFLQNKDDETNPNREIVRLLLNLFARDDYRRKFIDTFCLMGGSVFEPTRAGRIVDELLDYIKPMTILMNQKGIITGHDPGRTAATIKSKLNGRSKKMADHLKAFSKMKLNTTAQSVTLDTDTDGAILYINGLEVPYASFNGHLFAPIKLTAKAPAGYRFAGWEKDGEAFSDDESIDLPADETVKMTATFTALDDSVQDDSQCPHSSREFVIPVRINEVSAANGIYVNDYFKRNDWIELYNTTEEPIDVEGMYLSDNINKPLKYQIASVPAAFPVGSPTTGSTPADTHKKPTIIPAHGYLIVWCDNLIPLSQLHASFKLAAEGGAVVLTAADESWSDRLDYSLMRSDETVGRYPDGGDEVYVMNVPTIEHPNRYSSYMIPIPVTTEISDVPKVQVVPDTPFTLHSTGNRLMVRGTADGPITINVYNMMGVLMKSHHCSLVSGYAEVPIAQLPHGYYIARVTDSQGHISTIKFRIGGFHQFRADT